MAAVVAAIGLNMALFFQAAVSQLNVGGVSGALTQLVSSLFPGEGAIRQPSSTPLPSPQPAIVRTGSS